MGQFKVKTSKQNDKKAFSIAEALVTLMIVGVAMSSAAPLISKTMKNSQVGNFQIMRLNRDLDSIRNDINNIRNNYVTKSALTETLRSYVTTDALTRILSNYVTSTDLTDRLSGYVTTETYRSGIANFLTARDLNGYVTNETLDNYVTAEQLQTALANAQGVPAGTIAFFAASTCPTGWSRVPDTYNGRFPRFAGQYTINGFGSTAATTTTLSVGATQEDAIRNIQGTSTAHRNSKYYGSVVAVDGVFYDSEYSINGNGGSGGSYANYRLINFDASRVVPTAAENRPKSIALMGCVKDQYN